MKTNITAMLLGAVLIALVGCKVDPAATQLLIEAIDNETKEFKAVPIPQKSLYGTDIPIPVKEFYLRDFDDLYDYKWGTYAGLPKNITDVVYYVSESGTQPLRVMIYDYTEIGEEKVEGTTFTVFRLLNGRCHLTSDIFEGDHQQDGDWVRTSCLYTFVIFDGKLIITFFTLHPTRATPDSVIAQTVYTLPAEHLSNGAIPLWRGYSDEYATKYNDPSFRRWSSRGGAYLHAKPSDVKGFEVYHPTDKSFPIRIELNVVMKSDDGWVPERIFRGGRQGNVITFKLFPNLHRGDLVDNNVFNEAEPLGEWEYEIPPQYHELDIDVGVGSRYEDGYTVFQFMGTNQSD